MSKQLDAIKGCDVIHLYKKDDIMAKLFVKPFTNGEPVKKYYFEVVDKKGNTMFIFEDLSTTMSVAGRFGLDYRQVNYEERFEELEENDDE